MGINNSLNSLPTHALFSQIKKLLLRESLMQAAVPKLAHICITSRDGPSHFFAKVDFIEV